MKIQRKRVAIYVPNLTGGSGGAEVYGLLLAEVLSEKNIVTIFTFKQPNKLIDINDIYDKYSVKHFRTRYVKKYQNEQLRSFMAGIQLNRYSNKYDVFINCTIGRMCGMKGVYSIHIVHFPKKKYQGIIGRYFNARYLCSYNQFICNSEFTKRYLKEYWGVGGKVVYPPIAMKAVGEDVIEKKENVILAVDRIVKEKRIIEMIRAYKVLYDKMKEKYCFVIIGNKDDSEEKYYREIVAERKGYPIRILNDLTKDELIEWYKKAKFFWHAKGYNEGDDPIKAEHFGMTTVEAMANGCAPIVINKGGQREIVQHNVNGCLWDKIEQLEQYTLELVNYPERLHFIQFNATQSSIKFLMDGFRKQVHRNIII